MGSTVENKRAEFRRYLERSGVVEALTRALIALYSVHDKPDDPVAFVKNNLFENEPDPGGLLDQLEGALHRVHELEQELYQLQVAAGIAPDTSVTFAQGASASERELTPAEDSPPEMEKDIVEETIEVEVIIEQGDSGSAEEEAIVNVAEPQSNDVQAEDASIAEMKTEDLEVTMVQREATPRNEDDEPRNQRMSTSDEETTSDHISTVEPALTETPRIEIEPKKGKKKK